ncbi:hypothetical protein SHELI_v1c10650 [Spiroplasma helicoides]|uniref:Uncharacterized protein n=1 Tax=Spiroplasma helicoides TaxID=216938 RepID=A0A1B3SM53_9MOLU|nr:hypothetical protein [Spiroplasma helicoides]AOG61012.1 hypothetical protein SHELI_v1c10650 [Spiroplasma helicoides]
MKREDLVNWFSNKLLEDYKKSEDRLLSYVENSDVSKYNPHKDFFVDNLFKLIKWIDIDKLKDENLIILKKNIRKTSGSIKKDQKIINHIISIFEKITGEYTTENPNYNMDDLQKYIEIETKKVDIEDIYRNFRPSFSVEDVKSYFVTMKRLYFATLYVFNTELDTIGLNALRMYIALQTYLSIQWQKSSGRIRQLLSKYVDWRKMEANSFNVKNLQFSFLRGWIKNKDKYDIKTMILDSLIYKIKK